MQPTTTPQVRPGVLYGITHDIDGTPRIREPKVLRVGIGLPKGPAVNVWMRKDPQKPWCVRVGYNTNPDKGAVAKVYSFATREETETFYREQIKTAPECKHPRKTPYFCFTRQVVTENGTELFEPDFIAIEAHGATPTEIDVVFLKDEPFDGGYAIWSASELKCKGDGLNAMRNVSMATAEQKKEAAIAVKEHHALVDPAVIAIVMGQKYFPVSECWTNGCPYAGKDCKPGSNVRFQLAKNIRVGGTAYFATTGIRSTVQMFSSLYAIKTLTGGRLAGIPMKMCVRPFRSNHDGRAATQYAISFEFRSQDVESLQKNLIEQAMNFRNLALGAAPVRQIEGPEEIGFEDEAEMMEAEFSDGEPVQEQRPAAAVATEVKTAELAQKLRRKTEPKLAEQLSAEPAKDAPKMTPPVAVVEAGPAVNVPVSAEPSLAEKMRQSRAKVTGGDVEIQEDLF